MTDKQKTAALATGSGLMMGVALTMITFATIAFFSPHKIMVIWAGAEGKTYAKKISK